MMSARIPVDGNRAQEWGYLEFRLPHPRRCRRRLGIWKTDFGRLGVTAFGLQQRQLGGDLDAAAAALIEPRVERIGTDVLVAAFDEREMSFSGVEGLEAGAVAAGLCRFGRKSARQLH